MGNASSAGEYILQALFTCLFFSAFVALMGTKDFTQTLFMSVTAFVSAWVAKKFVVALVRSR